MMSILRVSVLILCLSAPATLAQSFDEGMRAYIAGDYETAMSEWQVLAENDEPRANAYLGRMYLEGKGVLRNYETAFELLSKAANGGDANGQFFLSTMYMQGLGIDANVNKALELLKLAAEQGSTFAMYVLGTTYSNSFKTVFDPILAEVWLRKAAQENFSNALELRNNLYNSMSTDEKDVVDASVHLQVEKSLVAIANSAILSEDAQTLAFIAMAFESGTFFYSNQYNDSPNEELGFLLELAPNNLIISLTPNWRLSAKYAEISAELGNLVGQLLIGEAYLEGKGVPQDYVMAYKWFSILASNNNEEGAVVSRNRTAELMTATQIAEAQALAREWFAAQNN